MRVAGATWLAAAALALLCRARCDVIFRVPEVLVRHAAASKSVGTGPTSARANTTNSKLNDSEKYEYSTDRDDAALNVKYEEYFVEHEVSMTDARAAAEKLNLKDVSDADGCGSCSRRELEYCETRLLADHCCCERRFLPEPFPWMPHTCYMGPARCRPLAHDCASYARLRDCCCRAQLARRWKGILSNSTRTGVSGASLLLLSMLLFVAYL